MAYILCPFLPKCCLSFSNLFDRFLYMLHSLQVLSLRLWLVFHFVIMAFCNKEVNFYEVKIIDFLCSLL